MKLLTLITLIFASFLSIDSFKVILHPSTNYFVKNTKQIHTKELILNSNLKNRLIETGKGGLLAYGVLNSIYYSLFTLIAFFLNKNSDLLFVSPALPLKNKIALASSKMGKILGLVWAGSQVTKAFRISGSIVLAPFFQNILDKHGKNNNLFVIICRLLLSGTIILILTLILITAFRLGF